MLGAFDETQNFISKKDLFKLHKILFLSLKLQCKPDTALDMNSKLDIYNTS